MLTVLKRTNGVLGQTPFRDISYNITETADAITFSIVLYDSNAIALDPMTMTFDKQKTAGKITTVMVSEKLHQFSLISTYNFNKILLSGVGSRQDYGITNVLRFYIDEETMDTTVALYYPATDIVGATNVDLPVTAYNIGEQFLENCPKAKARYLKWLEKQQIVGDPIDMASSITYLESQVDVLYDILKTIIAKIDIDVTKYQTLLNAVDATSVLTVKDIDKIVSEIQSDKASIRDIQKNYYTAKES
jgi:hypothetical protein